MMMPEEFESTLASFLEFITEYFRENPHEIEDTKWHKFRVYFRCQEGEEGTAWWEFTHPAICTWSSIDMSEHPWDGEVD